MTVHEQATDAICELMTAARGGDDTVIGAVIRRLTFELADDTEVLACLLGFVAVFAGQAISTISDELHGGDWAATVVTLREHLTQQG